MPLLRLVYMLDIHFTYIFFHKVFIMVFNSIISFFYWSYERLWHVYICLISLFQMIKCRNLLDFCSLTEGNKEAFGTICLPTQFASVQRQFSCLELPSNVHILICIMSVYGVDNFNMVYSDEDKYYEKRIFWYIYYVIKNWNHHINNT